MRLFKWMLFALVVATALMAIPLPARAQSKAIMEGTAATRYTIKVDTTNARVEIDTTSYSGGIAGVGLYTTSNVVVGTNANRNSAVIYATGTVSAQEAALTATGAAQYGLTLSTGMRFLGTRTGIVWQDQSVTTTSVAGPQGPAGGSSTQTVAAVNDNFLSSVNGSQTAFTLTQSPASTSTVLLVRDGLALMNPDDYTMTGTVINTVVAPAANTTEFWAKYLVYTSTYPGLLQSGAGAGGDLSGTYPNPTVAKATNDFNVGTSTLVVINGKAGIGTASPSTKLHILTQTSILSGLNGAGVAPASTGTYLLFDDQNGTSGTSQYIGFGGYGPYNGGVWPPAAFGYQQNTGAGFGNGSLNLWIRPGTTDVPPTLGMSISNTGAIRVGGSAATIAGCGTGSSVIGVANAGRITVGNGTTTSCSINFNSTYANTPACAVSSDSQALAIIVTESTTQLILQHAAFFLNGEILKYVCFGL